MIFYSESIILVVFLFLFLASGPLGVANSILDRCYAKFGYAAIELV